MFQFNTDTKMLGCCDVIFLTDIHRSEYVLVIIMNDCEISEQNVMKMS